MSPSDEETAETLSVTDLRRILLNIGSLFLAYLLPRLFTVAGVVVAARVLGVAEFGIYGTAAAFAVILSILATLGMMPLLIRDLARGPERAPELLRAAHVAKTASNLFMLTCLFVLARWVLQYPSSVQWASLLLGISYAVSAYGENLGAYFKAVERMHVWTEATALYGLVTGGLGVVLVLKTQSVVWFCLAPVAGYGASLCWLLGRAPSEVRWGRGAPFSHVEELLRSLVPFAASFVAMTVYYKVDFLLLERWRSSADVGLYTAAYKFVDILQALILVAVVAVFPRLSRRSVKNGVTGAGSRVTELALLMAVPVAGLIWLLRGPLVLGLFGSDFGGAVAVLAVLALVIPSLALNLLGAYVLAAAERMALVAAFYLGGLAVNVVLNALLIPMWGPVGAGVAMAASEACVAVSFLVALRREAVAMPSLRSGGLALAAGLAVVVVVALPDPSGGLFGGLMYAGLVAGIYWWGGAVPTEEWGLLRVALTEINGGSPFRQTGIGPP